MVMRTTEGRGVTVEVEELRARSQIADAARAARTAKTARATEVAGATEMMKIARAS